jgi:hypothetical protein
MNLKAIKVIRVFSFLVFLAASLASAWVKGSEPQVWNVQPWETVNVGDFSGTNPAGGKLLPLKLAAPRNGVSSGYVVVTRDGEALSGLNAKVSDFTQVGGGGRIAAAQAQVRVAEIAARNHSWMPISRFDRLVEKLPVDVAVVDPSKIKLKNFTPQSTAPVATAPLWVTVRVPSNTPKGSYASTLTIAAQGMRPQAVALELTVYDWVMPNPAEFNIRTIGWMNPEALAKHYEIPLWSERHFELMGQSMERMLELGSRHAIIDVGQNFPARDNSDTMIKWVKQPNGAYTYDFTIFDKYCDLVAAKIGKPFPLRLNLWRGPRNGGGGESTDYMHTRVLELDAASGETKVLEGPTKLGSDEMKAFWQPVMNEIKARLEKRGWMDVTSIGWMCYSGGMTTALSGMVDSIWPGAKWSDVTHGRVLRYKLPDGTYASLISGSTVWNEGTLAAYNKWTSGPYPRQYASILKSDTAFCTHARNQYNERNTPLLVTVRSKHEEALFKGNQGLECVGADHFPFRNQKGAPRAGAWSSFAQGPANATLALLGAGVDGLLGTERFEAMREGIQSAEAIASIQMAINEKRIAGALLDRANKLLDDRAKAYVASANYQDYTMGGKQQKRHVGVVREKYIDNALVLDAALFDLASEVGAAAKR